VTLCWGAIRINCLASNATLKDNANQTPDSLHPLVNRAIIRVVVMFIAAVWMFFDRDSYCVDAAGQVVIRRQLKRRYVLAHFFSPKVDCVPGVRGLELLNVVFQKRLARTFRQARGGAESLWPGLAFA
jgi:hypothetical protein